ncbi:hypothetical protein OS493_020671 [Desmophyllum pertusum]|uniref:Uncharacterized protein n=1 Tax=Desmophyllum pertusum TaxID=174260 RepID=A0A9W9YMQ0_9CNID|nr:hypothetical protein OS493_020671 [Desmophyllum pertusum]
MSDEEDGEGSQEGSWVVRSPQWRSPRLTTMLRELQSRVDSQAIYLQASKEYKSTRNTIHSPSTFFPSMGIDKRDSSGSDDDEDEDEDEVWHGLDKNPVAAQNQGVFDK